MRTGLSIHIGLNALDSRYYRRFNRCLAGCVNDAIAMRKLADSVGFQSHLLINEVATVGAVLDAIEHGRLRIGNDGLLLITYSGHGGRVHVGAPQVWDDAWMLFDGELRGDELYACWTRFPPRARVLVISDCCFSGRIIRGGGQAGEPTLVDESPQLVATRFRGLVKRRPNLELHGPVQARVLLLSACQDNELAEDGDEHGAFTQALLDVWDGGSFRGSYWEMYTAIRKLLGSKQNPAIFGIPNPAFAHEPAFSI